MATPLQLDAAKERMHHHNTQSAYTHKVPAIGQLTLVRSVQEVSHPFQGSQSQSSRENPRMYLAAGNFAILAGNLDITG